MTRFYTATIADMCFKISLVLFVTAQSAVAADDSITLIGDRQLVSHTQGGNLTNTANYQWWYGCSPTAAGMLIGYYDRNGYSNLVTISKRII
jgi:hypothetical protein